MRWVEHPVAWLLKQCSYEYSLCSSRGGSQHIQLRVPEHGKLQQACKILQDQIRSYNLNILPFGVASLRGLVDRAALDCGEASAEGRVQGFSVSSASSSFLL